MKDTTFYNKESSQYSSKRYASVAQSYLQLFYTRRLEITKKYLQKVLGNYTHKPSLLEVGCADGVIMREIAKAFPDSFATLVGVDISPGMIEEARRKNTHPNSTFLLREEYMGSQVEVLVETGVVNYSSVDAEIKFAHEHIKSGGWLILSVAGTGSIYNRIKHDSGLRDFRAYKEYDPVIRRYFTVHKVLGVGFFIPLIWKVPVIARPIQAFAESVMGRIAPGLCHEKMYLLKKR